MIQGLPINSSVKRILIGCMMLGLFYQADAQDIHFTDFRMAPTAINPGLTGAFRGTYRVNGIYRDQWRSVESSNPFKTFVGSVDFNVKGNLLLENDWIAGGLSFLQDKTGTNGLKRNLLGINIGYHIGMDNDYKNVVSFGVGYGKKSSSLSNGPALGFDIIGANDQSEIDNATRPCTFAGCENSEAQNRGSNDLSAGFTYKTELDNGTLARVGLSWLHLNSPDQTLLAQDTTMVPPGTGGGINRKGDGTRKNFVVFGEASTLISERIRLNPALLFMTAAGTTELQLQSTADYLVNAKNQFSLTGGLGLRVLPFDAAYLMGGVKMKDLTVRLSYDITLSSFRKAGGNGFELAVGYIGRIYRDPKVDKVIFCPRL